MHVTALQGSIDAQEAENACQLKHCVTARVTAPTGTTRTFAVSVNADCFVACFRRI